MYLQQHYFLDLEVKKNRTKIMQRTWIVLLSKTRLIGTSSLPLAVFILAIPPVVVVKSCHKQSVNVAVPDDDDVVMSMDQSVNAVNVNPTKFNTSISYPSTGADGSAIKMFVGPPDRMQLFPTSPSPPQDIVNWSNAGCNGPCDVSKVVSGQRIRL